MGWLSSGAGLGYWSSRRAGQLGLGRGSRGPGASVGVGVEM